MAKSRSFVSLALVPLALGASLAPRTLAREAPHAGGTPAIAPHVAIEQRGYRANIGERPPVPRRPVRIYGVEERYDPPRRQEIYTERQVIIHEWHGPAAVEPDRHTVSILGQ